MSLEIAVFSNLSRAEIYDRKVKGKSIYKIELKSTTFVKLRCVIINCNNFRARIFNQIQIPARETSRSRGSQLRRSPLAIRDRLVGKSIADTSDISILQQRRNALEAGISSLTVARDNLVNLLSTAEIDELTKRHDAWYMEHREIFKALNSKILETRSERDEHSSIISGRSKSSRASNNNNNNNKHLYSAQTKTVLGALQ